MGRVWLICCRIISWLLSGLLLLCPGSVPPSRSRSLPTQQHTGQRPLQHYPSKWVSVRSGLVCLSPAESTCLDLRGAGNEKHCTMGTNLKPLIWSFIFYKQLKCLAKSIHRIFNKSLTYFSSVLGRKKKRCSLHVSFVRGPMSFFWGPSGIRYSTDSAASHILSLHPLSGLTSASSQWQVSSSERSQTCTQTRDTLSKSCSDKMILSLSSSSSCYLSFCCCCIQMRP